MQQIENNAKYFTDLVKNQVRFTVPFCYLSWIEVLEEQRSQLHIIIEIAWSQRYRNYKLKAHNHLKEHEPSHPYGELSIEKWQKYIDFFTSPTFVVISSDVSIDERTIVREVLGERRRHICGIRHVLKGICPSLDLTLASNAPRGTSNQFCADVRIARLTANLEQRLPGVVSDDAKEVGKDMNDCRCLGDL
ncbi:Uncharacterized protein Adt_44816 [Abeliophyllum distichum]|uniref:Uncharacterized protein n=1 Tax=Abeliophyllum distichum TaxID=126358 RepID=A0ABD1PFM2_9LAMI